MRLTSVAYDDGTSVVLIFCVVGDLETRTERSGDVATYPHDVFNRLVDETRAPARPGTVL